MDTENKHGGSRSGAGRKPGLAANKTKLRPIYLTEYQWEHCFREVNSGGVGASEYVRRLVEADMKAHGKSLSPPDGWGE